MFVQIKYEPGNEKPNIFLLNNNATIRHLKFKLETIIEIPAEFQEIRTLTTLLDNDVDLSTVVEKQDNRIEINGKAISVYCGQKLICYLELYNETEGDIQRKFFDQMPQYLRRNIVPPTWKEAVVPNPQESKMQIKRSSPKLSVVEYPKESPTKCLISKDFPPYVSVSPEQRQFILIITKDLNKNNFSDLIHHFFVLFGSSANCDRFNFSKKDSVTEYDEKFWLICGNRITCDWITESLASLSDYKSHDFIEYFLLNRCSFTLPEVVENKNFFSVFQLLEEENCGLRTDKWCVMERKSLLATSEDYKDKADPQICQNEEITLWIDTESVEFIQKNNFQLKYCTWSLSFNLITE